ncbi:MAG: hypothetical protein UHK60_02775 [Acutalibacteraceae bacterium]|nr:hypothetical protein [Acutalibacteraceae bacterium]
MQQTFGKCPHCGKDIALNYLEREWKYGSPIRVCKKCNQKYLDKRYHEITVEGINPDSFNMRRIKFSLLFGVVFLLVSVLFNAYTILLKGYYHTSMVLLGLGGIMLIGYTLVDFIRIKTGAKQRSLEKVTIESVKRLQNKEYAQELASLGYNVPEKYL